MLSDFESHTKWMRDARSIEITSESTRGVGTRMRVLTAVGPFRTTDVIEVIRWEERRLIGVRHLGLVGGQGTLGMHPVGEHTDVFWKEVLVFPWRIGGPITESIAAPVLRSVWRENLRRLEETVSAL